MALNKKKLSPQYGERNDGLVYIILTFIDAIVTQSLCSTYNNKQYGRGSLIKIKVIRYELVKER